MATTPPDRRRERARRLALTVPLGRTKLSATVYSDRSGLTFSADLPLPPSAVSFDIAGSVPATATVVFAQLGKVLGRIHVRDASQTLAISSHAVYEVSLRDVTVNGVAANVGDDCSSVKPVIVYADTPAAKLFNLINGGELTSRYALGKFADCGDTTTLINRIVPAGLTSSASRSATATSAPDPDRRHRQPS